MVYTFKCPELDMEIKTSSEVKAIKFLESLALLITPDLDLGENKNAFTRKETPSLYGTYLNKPIVEIYPSDVWYHNEPDGLYTANIIKAIDNIMNALSYCEVWQDEVSKVFDFAMENKDPIEDEFGDLYDLSACRQ